MDAALVSGEDRTLHVDVQHVPVFRPLTWLQRGWLDMRSAVSLAYGVLIVAMGWTLLVLCGTHPYFIAAAISGFLLVGPVMSAGLCEMSRRYSLGESASFDESLDGFARNRHALFEFSAILAGCAVVWFGISAVMLGTVFHVAAPDVGETLYQGFLESTNSRIDESRAGIGVRRRWGTVGRRGVRCFRGRDTAHDRSARHRGTSHARERACGVEQHPRDGPLERADFDLDRHRLRNAACRLDLHCAASGSCHLACLQGHDSIEVQCRSRQKTI